MLEVCFSNAMKLNLLQAQHPHDPNVAGQPAISIYSTDGKKLGWIQRRKAIKSIRTFDRQRAEQAIPLGGEPDDLVGLFFLLSTGDISSPPARETCPRKQAFLYEMLLYPGEDPEEDRAYAEDLWQKSIDDMEKLKTRAASGESVRIWADHTPDAACGLLFTADLLKDADCPITIMYPPDQFESWFETIVNPCGWEEVPLELLGSYLVNAVELTNERKSLMAQQWQQLKAENAVFRVVRDQSVISAED